MGAKGLGCPPIGEDRAGLPPLIGIAHRSGALSMTRGTHECGEFGTAEAVGQAACASKRFNTLAESKYSYAMSRAARAWR
jgi:hypothetical protein